MTALLLQSGPGSLSTTAHVFITIGTVVMLLFIWRMLRRHQLRSKYALIWTGAALVLGALTVVPGVLDRVSDWVGIDYGPALFLLVAVGFLFLVVVDFSRELSRLDARTRTLAEEVAFLRAQADPGPADPAGRGAAGDDANPDERREPGEGPNYDRSTIGPQEPS